jgi:hypothetical protein
VRPESNRANAVRGRGAWRTGAPGKSRSGGQAVLMTLLVVLGVGLALLTNSATRSVSVQVRAETRTRAALAEAKQALVGPRDRRQRSPRQSCRVPMPSRIS